MKSIRVIILIPAFLLVIWSSCGSGETNNKVTYENSPYKTESGTVLFQTDEKAEYLFGCEIPELTQEEKVNCGVHIY